MRFEVFGAERQSAGQMYLVRDGGFVARFAQRPRQQFRKVSYYARFCRVAWKQGAANRVP
jgi:hypothetical protein